MGYFIQFHQVDVINIHTKTSGVQYRWREIGKLPSCLKKKNKTMAMDLYFSHLQSS